MVSTPGLDEANQVPWQKAGVGGALLEWAWPLRLSRVKTILLLLLASNLLVLLVLLR